MNLSALARDIIHVNPDFRKGRGVGHVRLIPNTPGYRLTTDECIFKLKLANKNVINIIPPGCENSKSSEFLTYQVLDSNNEIGYVVYGLGKIDKGSTFEKFFYEDLLSQEKSIYLPFLKNHIGNFQIDNIVDSYAKKVIRPFDLVPNNIGSVVADVTIKSKPQDIFLSLKNGKGSIMVGHGISGSFNEKDNTVKFSKGSVIDLMLEELGVSIDKMIDGFNNYCTKTYSNFERHEPINIKCKNNLKDLLGAAHGYGYYIVKKIGLNCNIIDVTTLDKLNNYIGDIVQAELYYPYYKTDIKKNKSMTIRVTTTEHIFQFVLRNKNGGIAPNTLELVKI